MYLRTIYEDDFRIGIFIYGGKPNIGTITVRITETSIIDLLIEIRPTHEYYEILNQLKKDTKGVSIEEFHNILNTYNLIYSGL